MKIKKIAAGMIAPLVGIIAALALVLAAVSLHVKLDTQTLFGQSASYRYVGTSAGASINGKTALYPSNQVVDTQTAVAAGTLNGTNSPAYDVSQLVVLGRMINVSFNVTAVPGTSPSLTPSVQCSDDGGQTFYTIKDQAGSTFTAITSTGAVTGLNFQVFGDVCRIHYVSSGTGNFTFTASFNQAQ